jgi:hypothetical protein
VDRLTAETEAARRNLTTAGEAAAAQLRAKDDIIVRLNKRIDDVLSDTGDMLTEVMRRLSLKIGQGDAEAAGGQALGAGGGSSTDLAAATLKRLQEMTV